MAHEDKFFLCAPGFFAVEYVINPWMRGNIGRVRRQQAQRQWERLRAALTERAHIELIEPAPGLPDMPFTANAGLATDDIFIPSRFRFPQRQPEVHLFAEWFRRQGYRIVELPGQGSFEGEGDALFQPGERLLWGGYGVRTSLHVYPSLSEILDVEVVALRLIDERFYHLDTCFCPLPGGRLLYYPDAFASDALALIEARIPAAKRYAVSATEALRFACNAIVVGDGVLTNFASDALRAQLAAWGFQVVRCPLDEFVLAGGAAKCLALRLNILPPAARAVQRECSACERLIEVRGHLLDRALMNRVLDCVTDAGGSFEVETFHPAVRHEQTSWMRLRVAAPSLAQLDEVVRRLAPLGAHVLDEALDARRMPVTLPGVAPEGFYGTTNFPTDVRIDGHWLRATHQRMDAVLVVDDTGATPRVACRLVRDLRIGDQVVCGTDGVRVHPPADLTGSGREPFGFMSAEVSSERHVEIAVDQLAADMQRIRARQGKIVVVGGPVVIHTGGGPHLAALIRRGYVQALLGGNGIAAHDIEHALFGTSLGVDLAHGMPVPGGHQHHLRAINMVRACGGIANAVRAGVITGGVFYECVTNEIPFALAGSIRDDGPLPDTIMDLVAAQDAYARLIEGADMILLLASMLHGIGVGNMTPANTRLICVDISPAVVTKLADRGSLETTGIVTDAGLFLSLLDARLAGSPDVAQAGEGRPSWARSA